MELKASMRVRDLLKQVHQERRQVCIHLDGGAELVGMVVDVGEQNVVLSQLVSREHFDALVRLDDVSAVEVQVRGS
tara:strand:+ start:194 stop:421 length:228 start_codon:yes stop_codon:yes gene_type:complete